MCEYKQLNILNEVNNPNTPFTNETINCFIELVREQYGYDMIDVRSYPDSTKYPPIDGNQFDIQILYSDIIDSGHYVCVIYDPKYRNVYLYDGLISKMNFLITEQHKAIMKHRYPFASKTTYVVPKTEQYDDTSSGPFVIAYALTLILGESPANYGFQMNATHSDAAIHLRDHIFEMFRTKRLTAFPR